MPYVTIARIPFSSRLDRMEPKSPKPSKFDQKPIIQTKQCDICFEQRPVENFFALAKCADHRYCLDCVNEHIVYNLDQGVVNRIPCPGGVECESKFQLKDILKLCSTEVTERFMKLNKIQNIAMDKYKKWCPTPDCDSQIQRSKCKCRGERSMCSECAQVYCFRCSQLWHGDNFCAEADDLNAFVDFDKFQEKNSQRFKRCPKCRTPIELTQGCNHMTCTRCTTHFCWLCSADITGKVSQHFTG